MSVSLGKLIYEVALDTKNFDKNLTESDKRMMKLSASAEKVGKKLTTSLTLPIIAAGAATLKFAADAEVSAKKFAGTFAGSIDKAKDAVKMLNEQYGFSTAQATELLANSGALVKSFGASSDQALNFSKQVQVLAAALSATNNIPVAEASEKITKAMLGETEGLKTLGVAISAANVEQGLLLKGQEKLTGDSLQLAKAQTILDIAYKQSADDLKTFEENTDSASFQTQSMLGDLQDLAILFGNVLLPVFKDIISGLRGFIQGLSNLSTGQLELIVVIAGVVAAIGPVLVGIANIQKAIVILNTTALLGPMGIVVGIGIAIAAFAKLISIANEAKKRAEEAKNIQAGGSTGDLNKDLETLQKRWTDIQAALIGGQSSLTQKQKQALIEEQAQIKETVRQINEKQKWQTMNEISAKKQAEAAKQEAAAQVLTNEELEKKKKIEENYLNTREKVLGILEDEKSETQKLKEKLEEIEKTKWASGKLEDDRLEAVRILKEKIIEAEKAEKDAAEQKIKDIESFEREWHNKVLEQAGDKITLIEQERDAAIAAAQEKGAAIADIEIYYAKTIQDEKDRIQKEADDKAKEEQDKKKAESEANFNKVVDYVTQVISSISEMFSSMASSLAEVTSGLEDKSDTLTDTYEKELDALNKKREALIKEGKSTKEVDAQITKLNKSYTAQKKILDDQITAQKKMNDGLTQMGNFLTGAGDSVVKFLQGDYVGGTIAAFSTLLQPALDIIGTLILENPALVTSLQNISDLFGELGSALGPIFVVLLETLVDIIEPFLPVLIKVLTLLADLLIVLEPLIDFTAAIITLVFNLVDLALTPLVWLFDVLADGMRDLYGDIDPVVNIIKRLGNLALTPLVWLFDLMADGMKSLYGDIKPVVNIIKWLGDGFWTLLRAVSAFFDALFGWVKNLGKGLGKGFANFFKFATGGQIYGYRAATGLEINAQPGGVPILAAENGYSELLFNAGPSGSGFRSEFASEVAGYVVRGLSSLSEGFYNSAASAVDRMAYGSTSGSGSGMNLTVVIEGMGQASVELTQEALKSGKIIVPARVIV